jgi:hypothetical protein
MKRKHVKVKRVVGVSDFVDHRIKETITRRTFVDHKNRVWEQLETSNRVGPWKCWPLPEEPTES